MSDTNLWIVRNRIDVAQDKKNQTIFELIFEQEEKYEMSRKTLFDAIITPIQVSQLSQKIRMESVFSRIVLSDSYIRYCKVISGNIHDFFDWTENFANKIE